MVILSGEISLYQILRDQVCAEKNKWNIIHGVTFGVTQQLPDTIQ